MKSIRVLIADDHSLIREGFKKLFEKEKDIEVAGEAENADEVLRFLRQKKCDIVVLDIAMPGKSGLDLLEEIRREWKGLPVLILTIYPEERFAVRALKSGASGYITKESAPLELVKAVRRVAEGKRYISLSLGEKLASEISGDSDKLPHERLSAREFQVFLMIARGKSVEAISAELHLSKSTVNTYRQRVLEKMRLSSNAEIIHYAAKNGLVD